MKVIEKPLYLMLVSLLCALNSIAGVKLTAKAPSVVSVGEPFRLQYSINASVAASPNIQSIPGVKVAYGPAISTSQSYQSINGHVSQSSSTSFTFTLVAEREGTFTLPAITVNVGGKSYTSNRTQVKAVKAGSTASKVSSSRKNAGQPYTPPQNNEVQDYHKISPSELYITSTANKYEVYEQEPLLLSYNVYTNLMLEQLQGKMPDLKGFVAKEIPLSRNKQLTLTRHNGRTVQTTTWSQYVMFPQQSGKLTVPSIKFEGVVAFPNRNVDPIDAFFYGSNVVTRVNHSVNAPSVNITVKPLPKSPVGFGGAVGHDFAIQSKLLTKEIRENETFNLQVVISGTGNIDLISPPKVEFPDDFEAYPPTTNAETKLTVNGLTGQLVVNYSATPNHKGTFVIPPVKFIYFNPQDAKYHTISTGSAIRVDVKKGSPNSLAARQRLKNDDIRDIHLGNVGTSGNSTFWLSAPFWLLDACLVLVILLIPFAVRRIDKIKNNQLFGRQNSGDKLPSVEEFKENIPEYYKQLLAAFRQFVALRTRTAEAELSKEKVRALLLQYGVEEKDIADCMDFVDNCEQHTYGAANSSVSEMNEQKLMVQNLMQRLKKQMKKGRRKSIRNSQSIAGLLLMVMLVCVPAGAYCQSKLKADSLYQQHHYSEALQQYKLLLKKQSNAPKLLYNAGNCYYRLKKYPEAILSYERSMRYNPADRDLRHNLTMARAHSTDKFYSASDLDLVFSFNYFVNTLSIDGWAWVSVISLFAIVCLCVVCRVSGKKYLRKVSAYVIASLAICIVLSNVFAYTQYCRCTDNTGAVIMTATPLRSTPDTSGKAILTLHGGTKVTLTDTSVPMWSEVKLPDGRKGWICNKDMENI